MLIALVQMHSVASMDKNLSAIVEHIRILSAQGVDLIVFPEAALYPFGQDDTAQVAKDTYQSSLETLQAEVAGSGSAVIVGMFAPASGQDNQTGTVFNELVYMQGSQRSIYQKHHLFDAFGYSESDTMVAGKPPVVVEYYDGETTLGLGLGICYDVRFPNQFIDLARAGAQVQIICASWADGPQKYDQWKTLLKARAMDTTCFVLGCGQAAPESKQGTLPPQHNQDLPQQPLGIGHSMIVDPWGKVLTEAGSKPEVIVADIDLKQVATARRDVPVVRSE